MPRAFARAVTLVAALVATVIARRAGAQVASIDPGMTQAQVVNKLGAPLSTRTANGHTYLFYKNGCEKTCGMNDLVVLDSGKVVDAVFRSPTRKYSGTSSSPVMISAAEARKESARTPKARVRVPSTPPKKP